MLRKLVFLCMMLLLAFVSYGARAVPDVISDVGRTDVSDAGLVPELADDSDSDIPTDPVEPMEEAVNIYIHVILMLDDGPPPPSGIYIMDAFYPPGQVILKANVDPGVLGGLHYNVYRSTGMPMYYADDLVELIDSPTRMYANDSYAGLPPEEVGPGNPDINWFYVYTTVDGAGNESTYPSPNVCEFDQRVIKSNGLSNSRNFVSYPCDHGFETLMDVIDGYPDMENCVNRIERWNPLSSNFDIVVRYRSFTGDFGIVGDASIELGDVFVIEFGRGDVDSTLFSTNVPGHIAPDRSYNFVTRSVDGVFLTTNHIFMMPMRHSYELALAVAPAPLKCKDIGIDIGGDYVNTIGEWNAYTQMMNTRASYVAGYGWGGTDLAYPGKPYIAKVTSSRPEAWPPTSTD